MFAVIALRFGPGEAGKKRLNMRVLDADGHDIVPTLEASLTVEAPAPGYTYRIQRMVSGLYGVRFPRFGEYAVRWLIDGTEVAETPLRVASNATQTA
jgi:hypothetical protein